MRRTNLFVERVERPRCAGGQIHIDSVVLEVTKKTKHCHIGDAVHYKS